jgi:hypothetical protein
MHHVNCLIYGIHETLWNANRDCNCNQQKHDQHTCKENEKGIIEIIPVPPLSELFGVDRDHKDLLIASIKELHKERRREAALESKKKRHI